MMQKWGNERGQLEKKKDFLTHLPQSEDILKGKLSLEPDEQPAETEAKRAAVLRVWRPRRTRAFLDGINIRIE